VPFWLHQLPNDTPPFKRPYLIAVQLQPTAKGWTVVAFAQPTRDVGAGSWSLSVSYATPPPPPPATPQPLMAHMGGAPAGAALVSSSSPGPAKPGSAASAAKALAAVVPGAASAAVVPVAVPAGASAAAGRVTAPVMLQELPALRAVSFDGMYAPNTRGVLARCGGQGRLNTPNVTSSSSNIPAWALPASQTPPTKGLLLVHATCSLTLCPSATPAFFKPFRYVIAPTAPISLAVSASVGPPATPSRLKLLDLKAAKEAAWASEDYPLLAQTLAAPAGGLGADGQQSGGAEGCAQLLLPGLMLAAGRYLVLLELDCEGSAAVWAAAGAASAAAPGAQQAERLASPPPRWRLQLLPSADEKVGARRRKVESVASPCVSRIKSQPSHPFSGLSDARPLPETDRCAPL
jgi:hypothetical protein